MKKIININFHGRVVPIEETAYDILKQYIESLRKYFANEEGRDEIINDIENRFAELFSERLKKDTTCITDDDVNEIIASMGRPEDFDEEGTERNSAGKQSQSSNQQSQTHTGATSRGRLYRNADDKIIGGVCSGLANYFNIDPVVLRIVFVALSGALFWVYILLWIVVPSKSQESKITKRLYRSSEDKIIAGVCGGLSSYFNIDVWIPRVIFALPLVIALISGTFHAMWWNWDFGFAPRIISSSLGSTLIISYIILWIAVPVATTSAEKLEMRGERVDLNSIRNTVKEDMESIRSRAEKWGNEVKESAQQLGQRAKEMGKTASSKVGSMASEAGPVVRRTGSGIGHVIGVLFKAFFLFIGGIVAISIFFTLLALIFAGVGLMPFKNFILEGFWENTYAMATLVLFLGVPLVAFLTWVIRRLMRVRSQNRFLGFIFGSLWVLGLISLICLIASIGSDFRSYRIVQAEIPITQPPHGRLILEVSEPTVHFEGAWWMHADASGWDINADSLKLSNVKIRVVKSEDSLYHIHKILTSFGYSRTDAETKASRVQYATTYRDSILDMGSGFSIDTKNKFRGQGVVIEIKVPENKKILFDRSLTERLNPFTIHFNNNTRRFWNNDYDVETDFDRNSFEWETDVDYVMTASGNLEKADQVDAVKPGSKTPGYKYKKGSSIEDEENTIQRKQEQLDEQKRQLEEKKKEQEQKKQTNYKSDEEDSDNSDADGARAEDGVVGKTTADGVGFLSFFARLIE